MKIKILLFCLSNSLFGIIYSQNNVNQELIWLLDNWTETINPAKFSQIKNNIKEKKIGLETTVSKLTFNESINSYSVINSFINSKNSVITSEFHFSDVNKFIDIEVNTNIYVTVVIDSIFVVSRDTLSISYTVLDCLSDQFLILLQKQKIKQKLMINDSLRLFFFPNVEINTNSVYLMDFYVFNSNTKKLIQNFKSENFAFFEPCDLFICSKSENSPSLTTYYTPDSSLISIDRNTSPFVYDINNDGNVDIFIPYFYDDLNVQASASDIEGMRIYLYKDGKFVFSESFSEIFSYLETYQVSKENDFLEVYSIGGYDKYIWYYKIKVDNPILFKNVIYDSEEDEMETILYDENGKKIFYEKKVGGFYGK